MAPTMNGFVAVYPRLTCHVGACCIRFRFKYIGKHKCATPRVLKLFHFVPNIALFGRNLASYIIPN